MRRAERVSILAMAVGGHALVLGYLAMTRDLPPMVEPPVMVVEVIRLPPPVAAQEPLRRLEPRQVQRPIALHAPKAPVAEVAPLPATPAPPVAAPSLRDAVLPPKPPLSPDRWKLRSDEARIADCQTAWTKAGYPGVAPCKRAEPLPANAYKLEADSKTAEFAPEARHNEAVRRYHELPGTAGFPGIGCAVFHKC